MPADAEDAFQATFLVLIRRQETARRQPILGAWLHRVSCLTVRNRQRTNRRREAGKLSGDSGSAGSGESIVDARLDIDVAISQLPERLRVPVLLCHLQGLSRSEAAKRIGCPEGTLSANLAEALRRLRRRFGVGESAAALAGVVVTLIPPKSARNDHSHLFLTKFNGPTRIGVDLNRRSFAHVLVSEMPGPVWEGCVRNDRRSEYRRNDWLGQHG